MEMPGIEPGAFHMRSERSTTELHPRPWIFINISFSIPPFTAGQSVHVGVLREVGDALLYFTVHFHLIVHERHSLCGLNYIDKKLGVEMPGIEPGAFHMQSERSTTELHPLHNDRTLNLSSVFSYHVYTCHSDY